MCQQLPGPRCWKDTSERHDKLIARLQRAESELKTITRALNDASSSNDYTKYEKARSRQTQAAEKVKSLSSEVSLNQRDMDGTKTGQKRLEQEMLETDDLAKRVVLERRMMTGAALAEARRHALNRKRENSFPVFRIQGEAQEKRAA